LAALVAGNGRSPWAVFLGAWNRLCFGSEALPWYTGRGDELGTPNSRIWQCDGLRVAGLLRTGCICWPGSGSHVWWDELSAGEDVVSVHLAVDFLDEPFVSPDDGENS
jgi:hypothetical protein